MQDATADDVWVTSIEADTGGAYRFTDGQPRFKTKAGEPLGFTDPIPAAAIQFRVLSARCEWQLDGCNHRVWLLVLKGSLKLFSPGQTSRQFDSGSIVQWLVPARDITGLSAVAPDGAVVAVVHIDGLPEHATTVTGSSEAERGSVGLQGLDAVRTVDAEGGRSRSSLARLPCLPVSAHMHVTPVYALDAVQLVYAYGDLDYQWHQAPQRQFVLPLTGGMVVDSGHGDRNEILPGDIYLGEDVAGQGHITRARDSQARFSVFAHLAAGIAPVS